MLLLRKLTNILPYLMRKNLEIQTNDLLRRLVKEMSCNDIQVQKIVLETINNLCTDIDIFLFADEAIEYGALLKLHQYGYLIHKDKEIRKLSYRLISTLIVNTVDTDCLEYISKIKMLKPLMGLLGLIPINLTAIIWMKN